MITYYVPWLQCIPTVAIIFNSSVLLLQLGGLSRATNKSIFQANWVDHERIFASWFYTRSFTNGAPSIWLCSYVAIFFMEWVYNFSCLWILKRMYTFAFCLYSWSAYITLHTSFCSHARLISMLDVALSLIAFVMVVGHLKFDISLTYQKSMGSLRMVWWILWIQGCMS